MKEDLSHSCRLRHGVPMGVARHKLTLTSVPTAVIFSPIGSGGSSNFSLEVE
jgi:hypothetical protein